MAEAPENTAAAFERALQYPIDGIELDVQLSGDGVPVVYHDPSLKKIDGSDGPVFSRSWEELSRMDAGAWFSQAFQGEPLLRLERVLDVYAPETRLLIELKPGGPVHPADYNASLVEKVADCIERYVPKSRRSRIMILSFAPNLLNAFSTRVPDLHCALNALCDDPGIYRLPNHVRGFSLPLPILTRDFCRSCHEEGACAMTYSCNSREQVETALGMGVDVVMTDDPATTAPYLKARKSFEPEQPASDGTERS
jgi:glycerophosphoryl diester phosphodiesterase